MNIYYQIVYTSTKTNFRTITAIYVVIQNDAILTHLGQSQVPGIGRRAEKEMIDGLKVLATVGVLLQHE